MCSKAYVSDIQQLSLFFKAVDQFKFKKHEILLKIVNFIEKKRLFRELSKFHGLCKFL